MTKNIFKNINECKYPLVQKYKIWLLIPVVVFLIAAIFFTVYAVTNHDVTVGINIGLDFTGGSAVTVNLGEDVNANFDQYADDIGDIIKKHGGQVSYEQIQGSGDGTSVYIRYKNAAGIDQVAENDAIKAEIEAKYPERFNESSDYAVAVKFIGSSASSTLISSAMIAIAVTIAFMLIYIFIRFEIISGVAAVIALLHDVIIMICLTIIFHIQVNSSFVAAVITIVAYSINNTIVVFDRVRENRKAQLAAGTTASKIDVDSLVNTSVFETFTRSMYSSLSTLIVVLLLGILGGSSLQEFVWPLVFGLFAGTFSSLVIAPSIYAQLEKKRIAKKAPTNTSSKPVKKVTAKNN